MEAPAAKGEYTEMMEISNGNPKVISGEARDAHIHNQLFSNPKLSQLMFDYMGGDGKYQQYINAAAIIGHFFIAFTVALLSISGAGPSTTCGIETTDPKTGMTIVQYKTCPEAEACALMREGKNGRVVFPYETWTERYNMYCDNEVKRNFYKSMYILFISIISCSVLQSADYFGRKFCFLATFVCCSGGAIITHFANDYGWKVMMLGAANASYIIYAGLFTFYLSESTCPKSDLFKIIVAGWMAAAPLGYMAFCLICLFTKNPEVLSFITMIAMVCSMGFPCLFCVESPQYLLEHYEIDKMIESVEGIRKFNSKPDNPELKQKILQEATKWVEEERSLQEKKSKEVTPLWRVLTTRQYLYQVIALSFIAFLLEILYFGVAMNIDSMGTSSATLNGILVSIVQLISSIIVIYKAHKMSRRPWLLILQSVLIVCGIFLVMLAFMADTLLKKILIGITTIVLIGGVANATATPFYHYNSELFPVELRGTGNCLVNVIANSLSMVTPFIDRKSVV